MLYFPPTRVESSINPRMDELCIFHNSDIPHLLFFFVKGELEFKMLQKSAEESAELDGVSS